MEWNYYDSFITVAGDCPAERGMIPPEKKNGRTKPRIEYEMLFNHPYTYTQEELLYQTYVQHKEISEEELSARGDQIREAFFQKPMPCLRASMLPKKYGWGLHFDTEGRIALVARESAEYDDFTNGNGGDLRILAAMRNSR
ncbi:DUF6157 family protein [Cohnella silvisoli]|uniref:DUF6157 family protein n=1 Tax=Cohnella silvisoli TaxID=2873699 RepID=A0ABV1KSS1_9BACL|nr:DUF6157 family protein [Cohnella silvisoli]MCD9022533.1 DUF6157 family protein [Cohnella silvisoli]